MSGYDVPDASGAFTRALFTIFDTQSRYGALIGTVKDYGISVIPDGWVPWLIYDLGLEDVVPYVRTFRQALAEGPAWQRARGTPTGIEIAIGWVNSEGKVAPPDGRHRWWEFQVGFTEPAKDQEQLRQLFGIINLSKASEDELFRMFSVDYDLRPVRMDQHRYDQNGIMDDYSGAPRWDGGPYISFGRRETGVIALDQETRRSTELDATGVTVWFTALRYDRDRVETSFPRPWMSTTEYDGTSYRPTYEDSWGNSVWADAPWGDNGDLEVFVAVTMNDEATIVTVYDDDTWPDDYPERDQSFAETGGSKTVQFHAETT